MKRTVLSLLFLCAGAGAAAAADLPVPTQEYQGIKYYSGGVGLEERHAIPQRFPLKLVFRTDKNNLISNVDVRITKAKKVVFEGRAENGPWLIINLPPGTYEVSADDGKKKVTAKVTLAPKQQRTVTLRWKTADVDMGL